MRVRVAFGGIQRLSVVTLGIGFPVLFGLPLLEFTWIGGLPTGFLVGATAGMIVVTGITWQAIGSVGSTGLTVDSLSLASWITIVRGSALVLFAGFVLIEPPGGSAAWIPAILFGLAAGLDGIDGWIARTRGTVSDVGERLDEGMDTLTVLFGTLVVVISGLAHWVFLAAGLAKFVFQAGIVVRRRRCLSVTPLDDRRLRIVVSAGVLLAIWVALVPPTGVDVGNLLTSIALVPFLAHFVRDWLVVSGRR